MMFVFLSQLKISAETVIEDNGYILQNFVDIR